jgi:hypothetical protein
MNRGPISRIRLVMNGAPPEGQRGKREDPGDTINDWIGEVEFEIFMKIRRGPEAEGRRQEAEDTQGW